VKDGPPAAQVGSFAVQAGSFSTRENADELAADLSKKGFAPVVRQETREGKPLFKLYAGVGMDRDGAVLLAENLRKAGYAGFVISEAR
jgi:cell division septation protein DedD